jgi:hypothetical protein
MTGIRFDRLSPFVSDRATILHNSRSELFSIRFLFAILPDGL